MVTQRAMRLPCAVEPGDPFAALDRGPDGVGDALVGRPREVAELRDLAGLVHGELDGGGLPRDVDDVAGQPERVDDAARRGLPGLLVALPREARTAGQRGRGGGRGRRRGGHELRRRRQRRLGLGPGRRRGGRGGGRAAATRSARATSREGAGTGWAVRAGGSRSAFLGRSRGGGARSTGGSTVTAGGAGTGSATGGVAGAGGWPVVATGGAAGGAADGAAGRPRVSAKAVMARIITTPMPMGSKGIPPRVLAALKVGTLAMRAAASDDWLWARRGGGPPAAAGPDREGGLGGHGRIGLGAQLQVLVAAGRDGELVGRDLGLGPASRACRSTCRVRGPGRPGRRPPERPGRRGNGRQGSTGEGRLARSGRNGRWGACVDECTQWWRRKHFAGRRNGQGCAPMSERDGGRRRTR